MMLRLHEEWRPDVMTGVAWIEVSSWGRVRSIDRQTEAVSPLGVVHLRFYSGQILAQRVTPKGYREVSIYISGANRKFRVNRLVCGAFHGPPARPDMEAAHTNGIRSENTPANLRWATGEENFADRVAHGMVARGERVGTAVLTDDRVKGIKRALRDGRSRRSLAAENSVTRATIDNIASEKTWGHVSV